MLRLPFQPVQRSLLGGFPGYQLAGGGCGFSLEGILRILLGYSGPPPFGQFKRTRICENEREKERMLLTEGTHLVDDRELVCQLNRRDLHHLYEE
jgi:hypothetical protein